MDLVGLGGKMRAAVGVKWGRGGACLYKDETDLYMGIARLLKVRIN